ncbi:MAG: hypothetical protein QM496_05405 [Verrucomicrobiota bacterium]
MYSDDDIQYALETTKILHEPDRRIDTFGTTSFQFVLVSQLMDSVSQVRVRNGTIDAERPRILRPEGYDDFSFEGFGEQAEAFREWFKRSGGDMAFLKYGFNFAKRNVTESIVHEGLAEVCDRVIEDIRSSGNPFRAVIQGVDDTWEISLLKFSMEMIRQSHGINEFDFKRKGLL